jgi:hypothetical protein
MASTFKSVSVRFIVTGTLFAVTLYLGARGELGTLWSLVLLLGLCAIGITESLTRRLLGDALPIMAPTIKGRKR